MRPLSRMTPFWATGSLIMTSCDDGRFENVLKMYSTGMSYIVVITLSSFFYVMLSSFYFVVKQLSFRARARLHHRREVFLLKGY
jgi:hypothetical protein